MDDLEITRKCAEAMELKLNQPWEDVFCYIECEYDERDFLLVGDVPIKIYDPLHDDGQCFALVKRFRLRTMYNSIGGWWTVKDDVHNDGSPSASAQSEDLNRAICLCVARLPAQQPADAAGER